jgi:hypothetical protein
MRSSTSSGAISIGRPRRFFALAAARMEGVSPLWASLRLACISSLIVVIRVPRVGAPIAGGRPAPSAAITALEGFPRG